MPTGDQICARCGNYIHPQHQTEKIAGYLIHLNKKDCR